jgi:hypothetical protein
MRANHAKAELPMTDRPDLDSFERGCLYRHDHTDQVYEFRGIARVPELDEERVGIFESIDDAGEVILATNAGYDHGERFTPIGDAIADDIGIAHGPR